MRNQYQYICNQYDTYLSLVIPWIDLLHRNGYLTDKQHASIYNDCEELVKILVHRCKKLDGAE